MKGQLHAHTAGSGDSQTPPAQAASWYVEHGYDFIVFTDHNVITEHPSVGEMLVVPGVELTRNLRVCEPPPEAGMACLLHVNALFVQPRGAPFTGVSLAETGALSRAELYRANIADARRLGGIAQLNHPNFHYGADAAIIARLVQEEDLRLFELANEAFDSNNAGDARHPSTEALWDAVLSRGHRLWGVASDDAHHYQDAAVVSARGEPVFTGDRGFVMVRASERTPEAIREALLSGDFYASTGVLLSRLERDGDALLVEVTEPHRFTVVSNRGEVVERAEGRALRVRVPEGPGRYLRVVIEAADGARAWTQPQWRE